jgi:transcriptional regulator with GAF, ATPase, and Fis domain
MRRALAAGERREGWGATVKIGAGKPRLVSISGAPMQHSAGSPCDPRVAYVIVVRAGESEEGAGTSSPTVFSGLVARSASMFRIFRLIENLDESDATVLLTGESGTGKEMVARAIHVHSQRRNKPFVAVNCGALPGELLESELFGHVRGAFTGAIRDRVGRFELADGGTIFLDEVGDLPLQLQVKLLRVLQERTFERVGESRTRSSDARVIAATNRDLRREVAEERFRDDLYYRLRVVPIEIPPLRERREDIEPLARHLLSRVNRRHNRNLRLSPDAMQNLLRYRWPGNVRELENALEYAVAVTRGQTILPASLPQEVRDASPEGVETPAVGGAPEAPSEEPPEPSEESRRGERERILEALEENQWRRASAAEALGISRTTLWRKMRELNLGS